MQVIKQKVQAGQHGTVLAALRAILQERGVPGLYQVCSTAMRKFILQIAAIFAELIKQISGVDS